MEWYQYKIPELSESDYLYWFSLMSDEKKERVNRFRFIDDRKRSVVGEMLARQAISKWCSILPESIRFSKGEFGKPYAVNLPVEFNISHSGDLVVCVIDQVPVGIDVEKIMPVDQRIVERVCTANELEYIFSGGETVYPLSSLSLRHFYEIWTFKEAFFKCIGTGITDFESTDFTLHNGMKQSCFIDDYCICVVSGT